MPDTDRDDRERGERVMALALASAVESPRGPDGYVRWAYAGGPDECKHGHAAGIPCPRCDAASRVGEQDYADMRTLDREASGE